MSKRSLNEKQMLNEADPSADVVFLRERIAALESDLSNQKSSTGEAMEVIHSLQGAIRQCKPVSFLYEPKSKSGAACEHVLHLSDWHYGATISAEEVDGFGVFSPAIADARINKLAQSIIRKTEAQRHGYVVPHLRIIGTADYISGDIHHELSVTNAFPSAVQAVKCGYALGGMLRMFSQYFETVTADLVTLDNHGRLTRKPQSAEGGMNNWGYVVAEIAKQHVVPLKNVTVNIHAKPTALIAVGPERYLAFHGHQIKGWAGKPYYGFDRRVAMEAVKRMGVPEQAFTKLVFGHFHHAFNGDLWIMGGSLSGTDAFDHSQGRHSKPHQTSWFVHPAHGEFDWTRWWL
jgi:hypothetical protein